jgi:hypothetical protein
MSHRRCRDEDCDVRSALGELAFDPSLCAENGEANTESECLPLAAELLAACGGPLRDLLVHWYVLLLLEHPGNDIGIVNCHMSDLVVGRVASRAEPVADGFLAPSFSDDLLERAAGVG